MKSTLYKKALLFILPLSYVVLSLVFLNRIQYFYINKYDSCYPYLLNGVNIASGHFRTGNLVHPGTPVEIFAGIVIFIKHLFAGNTILYQDVLLHPESYLFICSGVLIILFFLATYFAGTYVYKHSGNIMLALLFQMAPLFYSSMLGMAITLSAESGLTICGIFFIPYLYVNTIGIDPNSGKETTNKNSILFGLFTALLFTTKIYCLPIVVLVLFMIKKSRQRMVYLASFGIFSLILLFPLYSQLRNWAGFIKSMIFHSGAYGQGSAGVFSTSLYKDNIIEIFSTHYMFTGVYIFVLIAFLVKVLFVFRKEKDTFNSILPITGILVFFTLFIMIIAKQYRVDYPEPITHEVITVIKYYYFIPIIISFPLFIGSSYKILSPLLVPFYFFHSYKQKLLRVILVIFIILGVQYTYKSCYEGQNKELQFEKTKQFLSGWGDTPLIIVSDGDKACVEPALFLGISYSGRWDSPEYMAFTQKAYPSTYFYTTYNDEVVFWDHKTDISDILKTKEKVLVYLSGTDSTIDRIILKRICEEQGVLDKKIFSSANGYERIYFVKFNSLL